MLSRSLGGAAGVGAGAGVDGGVSEAVGELDVAGLVPGGGLPGVQPVKAREAVMASVKKNRDLMC